MYHVSAQGVDERMIDVHYYYYLTEVCTLFLACPTNACLPVEYSPVYRGFHNIVKNKLKLSEKVKNKSERRMTASVLKQNPNT